MTETDKGICDELNIAFQTVLRVENTHPKNLDQRKDMDMEVCRFL